MSARPTATSEPGGTGAQTDHLATEEALRRATVRVAATVPRSEVNGPGVRFVLWVQGCPLRCPGCWNPDTWDPRCGQAVPAAELLERILATDGIEGITLSGGEPFAQAEALSPLAAAVRRAGLSVFAFTGYPLRRLRRPAQRTLLSLCDVVVAGPFVARQRGWDHPWRGSANQRIHFLTDRYGPRDVPAERAFELHEQPDGSLLLTGFPPEPEWLIVGFR